MNKCKSCGYFLYADQHNDYIQEHYKDNRLFGHCLLYSEHYLDDYSKSKIHLSDPCGGLIVSEEDFGCVDWTEEQDEA